METSTLNTALLAEDRQSRGTSALISTLRFFLRLINYIFALMGLAVLIYAVYLYSEVKQREQISGYPWFIFTFGAVGILVIVTAMTALVGIARNSRFFLSMYGFLVTMILIAQAVLAILFFTDNSWRRHLPHDPTGEQKKVEKFLKANLKVVQWVGLAILIVEVLSILIAYSLSSAQRKLVAAMSDDEDEIWGRRASVPRQRRTSLPADSSSQPRRQDAWSARMREKYALDTSNFTYDPERADQELAQEQEAESKQNKSRCSIM